MQKLGTICVPDSSEVFISEEANLAIERRVDGGYSFHVIDPSKVVAEGKTGKSNFIVQVKGFVPIPGTNGKFTFSAYFPKPKESGAEPKEPKFTFNKV